MWCGEERLIRQIADAADGGGRESGTGKERVACDPAERRKTMVLARDLLTCPLPDSCPLSTVLKQANEDWISFWVSVARGDRHCVF